MIQKEGKLAGPRAMRAKGDDLFELKIPQLFLFLLSLQPPRWSNWENDYF